MRIIQTLKTSNDGAAGVIIAILMIGLFITVYALVQAVYVPQWMEQIEAEHMNVVASQFTDIKSSIDILSISQKEYMLISNPITLGSKEMPFFTSSRAYGTIDLRPNDCKIKLETLSGNYLYSLGTLEYSSENAYFIDQSHIYENGALILKQLDAELIIIEPSIFVQAYNELELNLVRLSENGKKCTASGYGTYPVQTKFLNFEEVEEIQGVEKITLITEYKEAWTNYFESSFSDYYSFTITNTTDNAGIVIDFSDTTIVDVNLIDINVQVTRGWIE